MWDLLLCLQLFFHIDLKKKDMMIARCFWVNCWLFIIHKLIFITVSSEYFISELSSAHRKKMLLIENHTREINWICWCYEARLDNSRAKTLLIIAQKWNTCSKHFFSHCCANENCDKIRLMIGNFLRLYIIVSYFIFYGEICLHIFKLLERKKIIFSCNINGVDVIAWSLASFAQNITNTQIPVAF